MPRQRLAATRISRRGLIGGATATAMIGAPGVLRAQAKPVTMKDVPADIVDRMQRALKAVIDQPDVTEKLIAQGQTPVGSTPKELADMLARETPIWADLIRQSGARVE